MTDDHRTCRECRHLKAGRCMNARAAQIGVWASIEIAPELAELPQRCPGYVPQRKVTT